MRGASAAIFSSRLGQPAGWTGRTPFPGAWGTVGEQLLPLRMPLFFAISGFFAANAVGRPWRVLGRSKVAKFLYLYGLWLCIHTVLLSLAPDFDTEKAHGVLHCLVLYRFLSKPWLFDLPAKRTPRPPPESLLPTQPITRTSPTP